jgi:predicted Zn-dependent protease
MPAADAHVARDNGAPPAERLDRVRRAAQAHPDDPRIFRLLGSLLNATRADPAEREKANRRAVTLDPLDPISSNNLAWFLLEQRRPMEALPFALRAVKRAPDDANVVDTYAMALFYAGRCQSAVEHELRAIELLRDTSASSSDRAGLMGHLAQMKGSCADGQSAR